MPAPAQLPVEVVQQHVRKQRRERRALWRPLLASLLDPVCEHPGFQVAADQTQHLLVVDPAGDPRHQRVVLDPVEEGVQIDVDRPRRAILDDWRAASTA